MQVQKAPPEYDFRMIIRNIVYKRYKMVEILGIVRSINSHSLLGAYKRSTKIFCTKKLNFAKLIYNIKESFIEKFKGWSLFL